MCYNYRVIIYKILIFAKGGIKIKKENLLIFFVSIFLGILIAFQTKTVNNILNVKLPINRSNNQLVNQIKKEREANKLLEDEIKSANKIVNNYEKGVVEEDDEVKEVFDDIQKYKIMIGYEDVHGSGILIEINDLYDDFFYFTDEQVLFEKKELLMFIINSLKLGGADAIAINDLRFTNHTEIEVAGNHFEINGTSTNTPFAIKAIGNQDNLYEVVKNLVDDSMFDIKITKEEDIVIPKANKTIEYKYAEPVLNSKR